MVEVWPKDGLEPVPGCPVCESDKRELLHDRLTDRVFFCAPGEWSLYKCYNCGCSYLDPRPTPEKIHLAYQEYYTHTAPSKSSSQPLSLLRRWRRALANDYRNWRFGTAFQPANKIGRFALRLSPKQRQTIDRSFRHLPPPLQGSCLLDVGFGNGAFLERAQAAGWEVSGVDPDATVVEQARERGLDVRQGDIEAFSDRPATFDAITLSHVIEHVHDPVDVLSLAYNLIKPGGQIWLETPNIDSLGHKQFGCNWHGLDPPRHLVLFDWPALEHLLQVTGFKHLQRLPKYDVYASQATKSRALQVGDSPYSPRSIELRDQARALLFELRARLDRRHSEFITLMATKPSLGQDSECKS